MCFLCVQSQDLPRYLAFWDYQRRDVPSPKAAHGLKAMAAVGIQKPPPGRQDSDDGVEKAPSLTDNVGESFVVSIGEIALKRSRLELVDRENRQQGLMTAKRFLIEAHHAAPSLLNSCRGSTLWLS
jgi:hypothetical protein